MPLYLYRCLECDREQTEFNTVANRHKGPECHGIMVMKITPPQIQAQILGGSKTPGYSCPVTGEYVTSRSRRRDIMKEHDLVEAVPNKERRARVYDATKGAMTSD